MDFTTPVTDFGKTFKIQPKDRMLALGSCFASVVGQKLYDNRFRITLNPFGTLYNPKSIFYVLNLCLDIIENKTSAKEIANEVVFKGPQDIWYTWLSASVICGKSQEECIESFSKILEETIATIQTLDVLMITFGTNHYYALIENDICFQQNMCVANCHKMPQKIFKEKEMPIDEIALCFNKTIERLSILRPHIKIIATVSPYRYLKYGLHQSQLSKSTLLLAINNAMKQHKNIYYFPAYEILNDELRDYRYYSKDMVHPSETAEEYIWEKFSEHYISSDLQSFFKEWNVVLKMQKHIPTSHITREKLNKDIENRTEIIKMKFPSMF